MFGLNSNYNQTCVFEDGDMILTYPIDAILRHANAEVCKVIEYLPTSILMWGVEPSIEQWSNEDLLYHFKRMMNANLSYPILMHDTLIVDGVHRIAKAATLGVSRLKVHRLRTLPPCNDIT